MYLYTHLNWSLLSKKTVTFQVVLITREPQFFFLRFFTFALFTLVLWPRLTYCEILFFGLRNILVVVPSFSFTTFITAILLEARQFKSFQTLKWLLCLKETRIINRHAQLNGVKSVTTNAGNFQLPYNGKVLTSPQESHIKYIDPNFIFSFSFALIFSSGTPLHYGFCCSSGLLNFWHCPKNESKKIDFETSAPIHNCLRHHIRRKSSVSQLYIHSFIVLFVS